MKVMGEADERARALQIKRLLWFINGVVSDGPDGDGARLLEAKRSVHHLLSRSDGLGRDVQQQLSECNRKLAEFKGPDKAVRADRDRVLQSAPVASPALAAPSAAADDMDDETSADKIQSLLQAQRDMHEKELQREHAKKAVLLEDLVQLTDALKESTLGISHSVKDQNVQLDEIQLFALRNEEELSEQKEKLTARRKGMEASFLTNLGMAFWLLALFVVTYLVIRLLPMPSPSAHTCPAPAADY